MSLLVFQAMLFASCNFVSLHIIKQLGFSSLRTARAEFYRRTKNTIPLGAEHLQDDIYRSSVFTPAIKRRQIGIFSKFLELMILLTDVLTLTYPFEDSVRSKSRFAEDEDLAFERCEASLKAWYVRVSAQFPPFENEPKDSYGKGNDQEKSIVLQTNLMYIYYHTASIALCHYKILRQSLTSDSAGEDTARPGRSLKLQQSSFEVQDAAQKITKCYEELTRRRLARWLPISALACLATPLTLHTITARLSSLSNELSCLIDDDLLAFVTDPKLSAADGDIFGEPLLELFDPQKLGISYDQQRNGIGAGGSSSQGGVDRMDWDLVEAMHDATENMLDRLGADFMA
uniref:Uncharacterized protein n=1 Tax=Fusarium oxysporum (strain Fo5176) TaxID=660025 RepID=A0A0D2XGB8_FUSOF